MLYKRDIVEHILAYKNDDNIIVLIGARQVGKTSILLFLKDLFEKANESVYYMDLENLHLLSILNKGPHEFINHLKEEGYNTDEDIRVLLDEIQYLDNPTNFLKFLFDHYKNIHLIVSGSSSFEIRKKFKDSLVGRILIFGIYPLSFSEFLKFKGLSTDFALTEKKILEFKNLFIEYVRFGGYPKIVLTADRVKKERYLEQIIDTYIRKDSRDIGNIRHIDKFNKLLEVLSQQSGNLLNIEELSNTSGLSKPTIENYLFLMENTFVIKLLLPYHKNIRSELYKNPKIYFYDTGLMQILWLKTIPLTVLGNVFETTIFSEFIKLYPRKQIFYWRTKDKKEIDFIIMDKNTPIPMEVKYNFGSVKMAAINYFKTKYKVNNFKIIGLEGKKENDFFLFPWQIKDVVNF